MFLLNWKLADLLTTIAGIFTDSTHDIDLQAD
jgi:hypothetical protein